MSRFSKLKLIVTAVRIALCLALAVPLLAVTADQAEARNPKKQVVAKNNKSSNVRSARSRIAKSRPQRAAPDASAPAAYLSRNYADIVIDAQTGRIIHSTDPDRLVHPASLTKMMTLYMTFQAIESGRLSPSQRLPVSALASRQSPSKLGLRAGQSIKVSDAVLGLITESANDAAVVLAEALGGSESGFAQMMTSQARSLGMSRTTFRNASGLPNPAQITTARDMAMLGHAIIYHYPGFYRSFSTQTFVYNGVEHDNHNHLMERYSGMDGIKTGYIRASGFNLVSSAVKGNTRLIGVVFGGRSAASRDNHMAKLLDQSFASVSNALAASYIPQSGSEPSHFSRSVTDAGYVALPAKPSGGSSNYREREEQPQESPAIPQPPPSMMPQPSTGMPTATAADNGTPSNWGVQIGAYYDANAGQQALSGIAGSMPQLIGKSDHILQKVAYSDGSSVYRARFMGMDKETARAICTRMIRGGQNCMVVIPDTVSN